MTWRLTQLRARHEALDRQVRAEERRPDADGLKVRELKRSKLAARDEIARLEAAPPSGA